MTERRHTKHSTHKHRPSHMKDHFDYLRRALVCAADTVLEELQFSADGVVAGVDGWGRYNTRNECRIYVGMYDWTTSQQVSGIL